MTENKKLYTAYEISKMFPITHKTVINWIKEGKVGIIIDGRYYIRDFEIKKLKELIQKLQKYRKRKKKMNLEKKEYTIEEVEKVLHIPKEIIKEIKNKEIFSVDEIEEIDSLINETIKLPKSLRPYKMTVFKNLFKLKELTGIDYRSMYRFLQSYRSLNILRNKLSNEDVEEIINLILQFGDISKIKKLCEKKFNKKFYTLSEIYRITGVHSSIVWKMCYKKKIEHLKFRKGYRTFILVPEGEIKKIYKLRKVKQ